MSDYLQNAQLQAVIKALGIPLPTPAKLKRDHSVFSADALSNKVLKVFTADQAPGDDWEKWLKSAGAQTPDAAPSYDGLLVDAGTLSTPADLEAVYAFLNAHIKQVVTSGKLVLVWSSANPGDAAYTGAYAMTGLVRALAKELGGRGITVNGLAVPRYRTPALGAAIFFLTGHSAFVTGQVIEVGADGAAIDFSLQGKKAIVTGGARGIGAETVRALARQGAVVGIVDVQPLAEDAEALAKEVGGWCLIQDITAPEASQVVLNAIKVHGGLDILVNNAGITRDKTIAKMPPHFWQQVFEVNLLALMRITDAILAEKAMADNGRVISLSSISGISGNVGQTNYSATKAGVIGYSRHLAATAGNGITANAIAPGFIETQMTANLPFFVKEGGRRLSSLKQVGVPQDIAEAIAFLAAPAAQGINGQVLRVCGGSFMGA
jgi:3-oxoacyl-[acyl-carrier protein] reductase